MGYRYIGAKTRLLSRIVGRIRATLPQGARVIDLMAGTGAVSAELRRAGYSVTACDLMTFSYHHCRVALLFADQPRFGSARNCMPTSRPLQEALIPWTRYEEMLHFLNSLSPAEGYFWREFSTEGRPANGSKPRNYFSPENACRIDAIRAAIRSLADGGEITDLEHSLLLHDLIMASNDVANIAGTYGHYLSVLRGRALSPICLTPTPLLCLPDKGRHQVLQGHAEELAPYLKGDLCYIDPPYMKRQYAANYHILETLAREDEPIAQGVSGLRPWRDQYSDFCSKARIRDAFAEVLTKISCERFLISYSDEGLLSPDELCKFLSSFGRIAVTRFPNKRFKSRDEESRAHVTEYMVDLRRRNDRPSRSMRGVPALAEHETDAT